MIGEKPRHANCGQPLSHVRDEWYCIKCWTTVEVPLLSQAEAAQELATPDGKTKASHVALPSPAWTEEERRTWDTWKEGDPVPVETKEMEDEPGLKTLNTAALGKSCIEELEAMARGTKGTAAAGKRTRPGPERGEFVCDVCGKVSPARAGAAIHRTRAHGQSLAVVA